ncbi:MAG: hypothetical protein KKF22_10925 [Gammaproteobacteria bacterium]|nr:hypothetical protein [Gammaproteobacteria bacterium]
MIRFWVQTFVISTFALFALCTKSYAAEGLKRPPAHPQLSQPTKRHVTINQQKFELLSQQEDHWLLYDPHIGQYCITLNQLVVVTSDLEPLLHKAGWPYHTEEWELLAEQTYRWSGSFAQLLQLQRKLKHMPDTRLEWQLQYLPQSKNAKM